MFWQKIRNSVSDRLFRDSGKSVPLYINSNPNVIVLRVYHASIYTEHCKHKTQPYIEGIIGLTKQLSHHVAEGMVKILN